MKTKKDVQDLIYRLKNMQKLMTTGFAYEDQIMKRELEWKIEILNWVLK